MAETMITDYYFDAELSAPHSGSRVEIASLDLLSATVRSSRLLRELSTRLACTSIQALEASRFKS
jgi:hypothetical protein